VRPTVFADVSNDMTIAREEIFGPVLSIIPFDTEAEALAIANDTPYGLTNYVQSQDDARRATGWPEAAVGHGRDERQEPGAGQPFGGMKASGTAARAGSGGSRTSCEVKAVSGWAAE
jgi:aldehyde dehydrogenase (NAD+)